jgi:hypothetical protein
MDDEAGEQVLKGPFAAVLCPLVGEIRALSECATFGLNGVERVDSIRAAVQVKAAVESVYPCCLTSIGPGASLR